ncbi:FliI/YscN family ATPase [Chitinimonas sp. BJB300]|uniref:FliI/YscN family ATPase n=1 Tax=Chitinimonas sp. BJB300 TaxID=1559339 RepID=UPI000C0F9BBF|nr:FliI/YscN family ATPase [Chitinimonas sp. BJB300]PHV11481.1 EscN/YscN/HrcN family type III secretion system ATPase [Chitinimonas sp. BJB300]TSJ88522.1 FliI/YscN family ATPase [Chitinimonas sp. BJB300]
MRLPDYQAILAALEPPTFTRTVHIGERYEGRLSEVSSTLLRAHLPGAALGELCEVQGMGMAEVIGVNGNDILLSPYREPLGVSTGMLVQPSGHRAEFGVGDAVLGRVLDALGQPIDGLPAPTVTSWRSVDADPPDPMQRAVISERFPVGVRAIDGMLTCGLGQRVGIFAPAGCGKSTLLGMLCAGSKADVVVLALVGERGREVREFLERVLTPEDRARSVVIVATSDRPALERLKAASTATAIAEHFRDQGANVLLLVDSLTRYARAVREIGLAAGEPIVAGGYPPSLYARLPRLLERAGPAAKGSITAFYTVLMEDKTDPLAEEVRSLLDGHIVLSRKQAEANHFPAIDVLASVSRVMYQVTPASHRDAAAHLRHLLGLWEEIELLVRVGEYKPGQDAEADEAMQRRHQIEAFLCQPVDTLSDYASTLAALGEAVGLPC